MNKLKFLFLLLPLVLAGCGEAGKESSIDRNASPAEGYDMAAEKTAGRGGAPSSNPPLPGDVSVQKISLEQPIEKAEPVQRKIIRNADLSLETPSPEEAQQKIAAIAESKGGFVIESQQSSTTAQATTRDRVTMTLRVPAEKFSESLDDIRKTASRVVVESSKGQDVTEEFVDIEARLKTKRDLEAQFLEILKQAKNVTDVLSVQEKLSGVRGEIEQIEGRKRFLENQSSLSTIKVTLQTPTAFSASPSGFFYQVGEALSKGFSAAMNFVLFFITFIIAILPFLILVVLPIYLVIRYFWKRFRRQILASKLAKEEKEEKTVKTE